MRELLFKNMTSLEKGRKILSLSETSSQNGIMTRIQRRFVYVIKEDSAADEIVAPPQFYIIKHRDTKQKTEEVFIRIKGQLCTVNANKIYLIQFCNSLRINLSMAAEAPQSNPS